MTPDRIIDEVCARLGVARHDLEGTDRGKYVSAARQVCYVLLREVLGMSYLDVARSVGRSDHTTAMAGYRAIRPAVDVSAWRAALGLPTGDERARWRDPTEPVRAALLRKVSESVARSVAKRAHA